MVTTLSRVGEALGGWGHEVRFITPQEFSTVPLPTYPEIPIALAPARRLARLLRDFQPEAVHLATEGPLGHAARRYCLRRALPFTTAYHTQFPRYIRMRAPVPVSWTYAWLRRFHRPAQRTLVATPSMARELEGYGFPHVVVWSRGVDTDLFKPRDKGFLGLPRPVSLYVGRVAVEKNLEDFLGLELPGTKVVVGEGPDRAELERRHPETRFLGYRYGEDLASHVAAADVFVFPSRTDTFGLTMLEAMACGVPVAAYPVTGPVDVVVDGVTGALDEDLGRAVARALDLSPESCITHARGRTWDHCARQFLDYLAPFRAEATG